MKHTYNVKGISCVGCQNSIENSLGNLLEVTNVEVDLKKSNVTIEMSSHIPLKKLQDTLNKLGLHYTIETLDSQNNEHQHQTHDTHNHDMKHSDKSVKGSGVFYCPMHCEGEKTYDDPGSCPVCGMDLLEQPQISQGIEYTCPMHPEIIRDKPGSCPICGMDLVPMKPAEDAEQKTYRELVKKIKIAVIFTLPIFIISMSELIPNNPC